MVHLKETNIVISIRTKILNYRIEKFITRTE